MSLKSLRSETIRVIDENANDFILDRKKSNNLVKVMGYLEVRLLYQESQTSRLVMLKSFRNVFGYHALSEFRITRCRMFSIQ